MKFWITRISNPLILKHFPPMIPNGFYPWSKTIIKAYQKGQPKHFYVGGGAWGYTTTANIISAFLFYTKKTAKEAIEEIHVDPDQSEDYVFTPCKVGIIEWTPTFP